MENSKSNEIVSADSNSFDKPSNNTFVADQIYPTPASPTSSDSFVNNSRINASQANNDQENDKLSSYNVKKSFISIATAVLRGAGVLMVIQYIFIVVISVIGNLLITVNPDTGEKINGPDSIIPSMLGEWKSFLIFVVGIVCLFISHKASKSNDAGVHKKTRARIETMEKERDAVHKSTTSNS